MSQLTVRIKKLIKQSELADWRIQLLVNNEETLSVPIKDRGAVYIASTLASLPDRIKDVPERYPFEYNMMHVSDPSAREAYVGYLDNKPVSADISLSAYKYIIDNIKQSNWVPETEKLKYMTSLRTSQTFPGINQSGGLSLEEYEVTNADENYNRFWLILEKTKTEVITGDSIRAYISGYAWPEGVKVPEFYEGFDLKDNSVDLSIKYLGVKDVYNNFEKEDLGKKYQLPLKELKKIQEEAKKFNELLIRDSDILAVSLQYNYLTKSFKLARDTKSLEAVVYGTDYRKIEDALEAIKSGAFKGYSINKEMLTPMYSKFKNLLIEHKNSLPMPVVLYDGLAEHTQGDALDVLKWQEELSIHNNPIQYSSVSALLNGKSLNTVDYGDSLTDTDVREIAKVALNTIRTHNLGASENEIRILNQPQGAPPQGSDEEEEENEPIEGVEDNSDDFTRLTPEDADLVSKESYNRHQFLNNDNPIPPLDDRLLSGEIYSRMSQGKEELPWDYVNKVRIGDVFLPIPPTAIRMDRQYTTKKIQTMRSKTSLQTGVGNTRNIITLDIYYATMEDVNGTEMEGHEGVTYYMDGLRPLIAQFKKAPFLPIDNEYINLSLKVDNVVLRNLQVQTVPGFPEALKATLILEEFDLQPYIIGETQLGSLINYPLLRFHYQRSLHLYEDSEEDEVYKTYLPPLEKLSNEFELFLVDENALANRNNLGRALRSLVTPTQYRINREKELQGNEVDGEEYEEGEEPTKEIREPLANIEKDYDNLVNARRQYQMLVEELNNQEEAAKFGLEGNYTEVGEIPVIPGGYYNYDWGLSDEEVKYGHRMAVKLFGAEIGRENEKWEVSKIPNPTNEAHSTNHGTQNNYGNWGNTKTGMFLSRHLVASEYDPRHAQNNQRLEDEGHNTPIRGANVTLPHYSQIANGRHGEGNALRGVYSEVLEEGGPGWYVIPFESRLMRNELMKRIEVSDLEKWSEYQTSVFISLRAGDPEIEELMDDVISSIQVYFQDVHNYEEEYNKLLDKINETEKDLRMAKQYIPGIIPSNLTVSLENTFSAQQVQTAETPTLQFFGASDPEVLITFETNESGVAALEDVFRKVARYTKTYREGIVSGFLGIKNDLVNMFGIKDIIPTSVQYDTVEGHPERRMVTLVASSFDKTQRRQESIYSFSSGDPEKRDGMMDRMYRGREVNSDGEVKYKGYDPSQDHRFVNRYLSQMELYPDLEMPMVAELNKALPTMRTMGFDRWPNRTNQLYLDPDFYVSTNQTFKRIVNDVLHGHGSEDRELRTEDTTGYVTDNKLEDESVTNFVTAGKSGKNFEDEGEESYFADSTLLWENYGNEHKFQPIIIGVTHGNLSGSGGVGAGGNFGSSPDSYAPLGGSNVASEIPDGLTDLNIQVDYLTPNGVQSGGKGNTIQEIILHDTGNRDAGSDARMHHEYQRGGSEGRESSWHYQVDDSVAIQSFPHDEICYHAGNGNPGGIGIEMCINSDGNFEQAVHNTAKLMASLCYVYGWDPNQNIRTHQDCTGKYCPKSLLSGDGGWSVQKIYDLTAQYLTQIQSNNPQGAYSTTTEDVVKTSQVIPSFSVWSSWHGNENKKMADYNRFKNEIMSNTINQEELWFTIADLTIKYFGPDLMAASEEFQHILNRTVPYKKTIGDINMEREYLIDRELGVLSFTSSDAYYEIRRRKNFQAGLMKNGREKTRGSKEVQGRGDIDISPRFDNDPLQRIMLYIKSLIMVESGGQLTINGQPVLKDKNAQGAYTKAGLAGARLTETTPDNAIRLMWDWRYNLEFVIRQMSAVYKDARKSSYNDIKYSAIDWAIASRSWDELPRALREVGPTVDIDTGYMNGYVCPTRNYLWQQVENQFNSLTMLMTSVDRAPILYADMHGAPIPNIHHIYTGQERTSRPISNYDSNGNKMPDYKYLPGYQERTIDRKLEELKETARKQVEKQLKDGHITEDEVEDAVRKIIERGIEKINDNGPQHTLTDEEIESNITSMGHNESELSMNYAETSPGESVHQMYVDLLGYNQTGRLLRAFPTFIVQLVDEGKWFSRFKTWDNFYGYNALESIDVYKSRKIVADTAIVKMSNMYSGLTSKREDMGYDDLEKPSFFSSQFWKHYVMGTPKEEVFDQRRNLAQTMSLKPGARLHIRMGYGADPFGLPIVFNGTIAEVDTGEVVTIVAQGDGIELTNAIGGDEGEDTKGIFGGVKAPRDVVGKILTSKGNWIKDVLNDVTDAYLFKNIPSGVAHFGSTIHTEAGNRSIFNDDYGEAMMNFYTNDGTGSKSNFHDDNSHLISVINYYIDYQPTGLKSPLDIGRDEDEDAADEERENAEPGMNVLFGKGGAFDEDNILVSMYGATLWDIIQTFALCSPDYHAAVVPFEYRSTLFFGQLHWPLIYAADSSYYADSQTGEWVREIKEDGWLKKTFMQGHIVNSDYNLIQNNIKASADGVYNNVIVSYDGHQTPIIQADADIRYDQQRTAFIEGSIITRHDSGLFSGVRNFFTTEVQAMIYGHSTVRDFMKDIYKGSYIMLGEGSLKPHDLMYFSDNVQDMEGIHNVKAVHHSMNLQEGFISTVEPDAYVVNFDNVGLYVGMMAWTVGKNVIGRLQFTKSRPSADHTSLGINSGFSFSSVLDKLVYVINYMGETPYVRGYPSSYIAGLMRKTYGLYFKEVGRALSDDFIMERANRLFDTNSELSDFHISSLAYYLNAYKPNRYSESIKAAIEEQEEIQQANAKFKYNHKSFYNGTNLSEIVAIMSEEAAEAATVFEDFWKNYSAGRAVSFTSIEERFKSLLEAYANEQGIEEEQISDDMRDYFLEKARNDITETSPTIGVTGPTTMDVLLAPARFVRNADKFLSGLTKAAIYGTVDFFMTPFHTTVAAIGRLWDSKKQNSECVKVIPMNYKGSEFVAAMEGHRGGVYGDTPSEWDTWLNATWDTDMAWHLKAYPALMNSWFSDN